MQDLIGRTLGHYRIVEKIGEGGMGEVYRAHDERLDRDVAIKVLPEAVAQDADRLARFEREAKLLAALNHSNIATLHGLEGEGNTHYLVMELVEGESLATAIARGPFPADEAVPIAIQIAQALETAHGQGIIHRDLKPANVMVSPDGKVKVLDFGLAKAFDPEASSPMSPESLAESPTLTADLTRSGVLLGTAPYMSPEQARGKAVDKRADVWAFGCTLYEMLTGTRPFYGTSSTEVLAAIIKEEPEWNDLSADTPTAARRLLRRCLTKEPRNRLHDIADVRIELQSLSVGDFYEDESAASAPLRAGWRTWLPWGMAAVFSVIAVTILIGSLRPSSPGRVTKLLLGVKPAERLGSAAGGGWKTEESRLSRIAMAVSPDGRYLVYSAGDDTDSRLYLRAMDEVMASPIPGTEGGVGPFLSPDGEWIGFWTDGQFKKVRIDGGPPMPVCDTPVAPFGANWGPGNSIVFGQYLGGVLRVSAEGGEPEEITALAKGEIAHRNPQLLDDGETLLLTVIKTRIGASDEASIVAQSLKTGERKILVNNGADARYAPTGHLVFVRLGSLMAVPFDLDHLGITGGAVVVSESVRQGVNSADTRIETFCGQFNFSASGTLVHVPGGVWPDQQDSLVWVDRAGREEPLSIPPASYNCPRLSPDGTRFAVQNIGFQQHDIWVYEFSRGTFTRLTMGKSVNLWPLWTPDGSRITFRSNWYGASNIRWTPADGSGSEEELLSMRKGESLNPASWSPDTEELALVQYNDDHDCDIWTLRLGGEPEPFLESPYSEMWPAFSPDGRWLVYGSNQSGRNEIYVTPYPGLGPKIQISIDGGISPAWAPNGRELFFRRLPDSKGRAPMMAVDIATEPEFSVGIARELFTGDFGAASPIRGYDITPDGKKFLMVKVGPRPVEPVTHLHVTLNWFEELKRLVPTE